ncbi:hypothetical protein CAT723_04920 [Corynebacterium ammoniagenes]|uniref:Uncharacterized protein n=1 Tax=Corynebacterium ammoniagenes TaxID=1697 RepID=A0AAV5G1M6_CORAM|nr:hypothetical protein CAT723_04920 [Corynebacterium ammoniagenes]
MLGALAFSDLFVAIVRNSSNMSAPILAIDPKVAITLIPEALATSVRTRRAYERRHHPLIATKKAKLAPTNAIRTIVTKGLLMAKKTIRAVAMIVVR